MDSEVQTEVVSDEDEELIGNWSKGCSCYALAKRLVTLCPCSRDLWNFELERDDLGVCQNKFLSFLKLYFKFWDTCAECAGLLHRYTHAMVVCCTQQPIIYIRYFS